MGPVANKKRTTSQEPRRIREMFSSIAPRYDLLNRLLSMGTDVAWRRLAAREVLQPGDRRILDIACGTGDLAMDLKSTAEAGAFVVGVDFTGAMLRLARGKDPGIPWIEADGLKLPFPDATFDVATIAFGIRNMASLEAALKEMARVLRPGGRLAVLEFTRPDNALVRAVYYPYFLHVLPRVGALLSRKSAYLYLPKSVMEFPDRRKLAAMMRRCGFAKVKHATLSFGIAALHIATR